MYYNITINLNRYEIDALLNVYHSRPAQLHYIQRLIKFGLLYRSTSGLYVTDIGLKLISNYF